MCMTDDGEPWEFYSHKDRRAAKPHRCEECNRWIESGEVYRYGAGKCDGWFTNSRTCLQCVQATRWLTKVCSGYLVAAVEEDLGHHIRGEEEGELSSSHLVRLVRWMDADWKDRTGSLRPVADVEAVVDRALTAYQAKYDDALRAGALSR